MEGRRRNAKTFGSPGNRRIIDGLDVDSLDRQKQVAGPLAESGVANLPNGNRL